MSGPRVNMHLTKELHHPSYVRNVECVKKGTGDDEKAKRILKS